MKLEIKLKNNREMFSLMKNHINVIYKTRFSGDTNLSEYSKKYKTNADYLRKEYNLSHQEYDNVYGFVKDNLKMHPNMMEKIYRCKNNGQ